MARASIVAKQRRVRNRKSAGLGLTGLLGVLLADPRHKPLGLMTGSTESVVSGGSGEAPRSGSMLHPSAPLT